MAELSLWLDHYNDIYSDFDSRHYLKRRVSEDFLYELRHALKNREEKIHELLLFLPEKSRNENHEKDIVENLKQFFKTRYQTQAGRCRTKFNRGVLFGLIGITIMVINSFLVFKSFDSWPVVAIGVVFEPAGWFLLWASFDFIFNDWKEMKNEREFFRELSAINIHFRPDTDS